jgi:thymidine kinase
MVHITLITGPMKSGKTTELWRIVERSMRAHKKVCLLRPVVDSRPYKTHSEATDIHFNGLSFPTYWISTQESVDVIDDLIAEFLVHYDTVCIDEGQFLNFILPYIIENMIKEEKKMNQECQPMNIFVAGLLSDSDAKVFKPIVDILPYCDSIIKLTSVCEKCGSERGNYSSFTGNDKTSQIKVSDDYKSLCEHCYEFSFEGKKPIIHRVEMPIQGILQSDDSYEKECTRLIEEAKKKHGKVLPNSIDEPFIY